MSTITIPGYKIAYKTWGSPELPPLLAIHGWLDNANSFDLLAPFLASKFHVVAIDLPGHGHSSHLPEGCNYYFIDGIFIVLEIINAFGFPKVHLLGHSMGACLASLIAGVAPERILSLVLIEGLGPFSNPENSCCEQLTNFAQRSLTSSDKKARPYPSKALATQARTKRGYLAQEHVETLSQRGLEKKQNAFYWRHDRRLLTSTPLRLTEEQILSCLRNIKTSCYLIIANQGFAFNNSLMEGREKAVKHLKIERLEGGHHIHMEQPGTVAECLAQFYLSSCQ